MKKDRGLRNLRLLLLIGSATKHDFRQLETQDIVRFPEQGCCIGAGIKNVLSHSYELGALSGKNISSHLRWFELVLQK